MSKKLLMKITPFILIFSLVLPSVFGQALPVVAAGNDGESVFQTEAAGTGEESGSEEETIIGENTEAGEETGETALAAEVASGGAVTYADEVTAEGEDDIYAVPFKSYYVLTTSSTAGTALSGGMPSWNERAMIKVTSGGAITVTFQIYNSVPYEAFQVMKWEESEKLTFGVASPDKDGNKALAAVPMGTFNVDETYLAENPTVAGKWFSADNNAIYDDSVEVNQDEKSGYTYLTMNLDSMDRLSEKMVIKIFYRGYTLPVSTDFFVFDLDNMVRIPDISEYESGTKTIQISDVRGNKPNSKFSNLVTGDSLVNVQKLFSTAETTDNGDGTLTVSGELNSEAFEGIYGVRYIRKLTEKVIPDSNASDILYYYHPYYNASFHNLDITGNRFELTFDLTEENLVFGIPLSIKTQDGLSTELPSSDEELDQLSSAYVMLHVLEDVSPVEVTGANGEIRLVTDTSVVPSGYGFYVSQDVEDFTFPNEYNSVEAIAATDEDGNPSFRAYHYEIRTSAGTYPNLIKPVEIGLKIPEGWSENEIYVTHMDIKSTGSGSPSTYTPSKLTIEDGYIIFNVTNPTGEFYVYLQNIPTDLNALADGIYRVNISALHSNVDGRVSMADAALVKSAVLKLSTDENGKKVKELYLDFQVMQFAGIEGYLSNVGAADSYEINNEEADITWGEVLDYFTVDGTDDLLIDKTYKESFNYTMYLVKSAKITLKDYTGVNSDTDLYKNYYPVYFEVPPMDSDPTDGINAQVVRLMINNCVKVDESAIPTYQKTVLKKVILDGKAISGEVYTTESFKTLQDTIAAAEAVYNSYPDETAIINSAAAVQTAINELIVDPDKMADKTGLEALLSQAKALQAGNYTASSYSNLQSAITDAEGVYAKAAATQTEVDVQVTALQAAITALVFIDLGSVAPNQLPDGTYTIPIRLWHAIKDQASMGDAALDSTGILKIENGIATLQIELQPLTFAGLIGYLMQFDTLSGYTIGTSGYPENYIKNPAAVLETYDYVDQYNKADSADEICRGQKYPKTLAVNVTLPESTGVNYTWVHVYVPVMGELDSGDQEARLRLDYTAIAKVGEPTISLDHATLALTPGDTQTLTAALTDSEESIVWTSDNSSVATVNNSGLVTAVTVGTATITAAAGNIAASCIVTVAAESTGGGSEGGTGDGSGGSGEELKDGTYSIPVKLWHASKNQASMGNAALAQTAKLVIKDGDGTLYITFQKMTYAGQNGYLAELEPSTVISTYSVVDQFNSETSTDDRVKGVKYPKKLAVSVVPGDEFKKVSVYVPVMGALGVGEQDARLKLDYSSARYTSSSTQLETPASDEDLHFDEGEAVEGAGDDSSDKLLVEENGVKYFYENDIKLTSQLISYWGKLYYAGEDGAVATSQFVTVSGNKYYAGEDGAMVTYTMVTDNSKTYYAGKGGVIVTSVLFNYKGNYYYAYKTGRLAASALITYEGNKYYIGKAGVMVTSKMVTYKDKKYYANKTGVIATSAMLTINGKKYYAYKTGRIATSTMVTYNGKKYYAYVTGRIATSTMVTYKGKKYYASKTGNIAISALVTYNGKKYYAYKTGRIATSALVTYNGKQYYAYKTGRIAVSALVTYKNNQYYVGKDGAVVTSKGVTLNGTRYYADKSGKLTKIA